MMSKSLTTIAATAMILTASPTAAQSMSAEVFHKRATALMKKGPMALFSRGEIKALMTEGQAAGKKAGEQRRAAVIASKPPRYCPPEGAKLDHSDFMKRLGAIPQAERTRIDMTEATTRILAARFPCSA